MTQMTLDGLPEFRTIVIDWPWDERGGCGRGTKYPTIRTLTELHRVVVESPAWRPAADAHLYVWQTVTHIEEPFELVRMLGFRRVSGETWVKSEPKEDEPTEDDHIIGMGQYRRQVAEFVLIATRGKAYVPPPSERLDSVFYAPRGKMGHSAKPDLFYTRLEKASLGPRVDIFARTKRQGWWTWGNELGPDLQAPL